MFYQTINNSTFMEPLTEMCDEEGEYLKPEGILRNEDDRSDEHFSGGKKTFHNDIATDNDEKQYEIFL